MTKRGMDDYFEMMTNPRMIAWSIVLGLAIVTAIVAYDA